jgi:hypothetical protein
MTRANCNILLRYRVIRTTRDPLAAGQEVTMSFLKQLFGRDDPKAAQASRMFTQFGSDLFHTPKAAAADLAASRRELMRTVLRKTLTRHGIPTSWIGAEMLIATARGRETGMHWRLLVKHWDTRLLTHAVALQNSLVMRLLGYDPLAADWLMGISWQFALPDEVSCPPLPQPGFWTADHRPEATDAIDDEAPEPSGDVIAGPVRVATPTAAPVDDERDSVRRDLDQLLAIRDAELKRHADQYGASEPTQPMYLNTEPQPLAPARRHVP